VKSRVRYRLTLEVQPDRRLPLSEPDPPPVVTLRRALKSLWRGFRLRAVRVEEDTGGVWSKPDSSVPFDGDGAGV
jgi:hypothetical protein